MMARYIDADKLKEKLKEIRGRALSDFESGMLLGNEKAQAALEMMPAEDVVEVVHGYWKRGIPYVCSICGYPASDERNTSERYSCWLSPYCPNCGAKMDVSKMEMTTEGDTSAFATTKEEHYEAR